MISRLNELSIDSLHIANQKDTLSKLRDELITSIINKKEQLYKNAIEFVSNGKEWSNEEIKQRCTIEIAQDKIETFLIDDVPMIMFFPNKYGQKTERMSSSMICKFDYKELYKGEIIIKNWER